MSRLGPTLVLIAMIVGIAFVYKGNANESGFDSVVKPMCMTLLGDKCWYVYHHP